MSEKLKSVFAASGAEIKKYRDKFKINERPYTKADQPIPYLISILGEEFISNPEVSTHLVDWTANESQFVNLMRSFEEKVPTGPKTPVDGYVLGSVAVDSIYEAKAARTGGYLVLDSETLQPAKLSIPALRAMAGADYYNEVMVPTALCYNHVFDSVSPSWRTRPNVAEPEVLDVNAYIPPTVHLLKNRTDTDIKIIVEFLRYLVPDQDQRLWLYSWMAHAVTTRAKTILCLVGKEATGKTTFANLMKALVCGFDEYSAGYFFKGSSRFLSDRFSGHLLNRRLVFLDEFQMLNRNHLDKLKDIIEDDANREAKFQNQITHKNTLSFIIANNWTSALWIHPATGRKFSVPDIAKERLDNHFTQGDLEELNNKISDPSAISKLYRNLFFKHLNKFPNDAPLHGYTYEQITRVSAPAFIQTILKNEIDEAKKPGEEWSVEDLMIDHKDKQWSEARAVSEIIDFFRTYKQNKNFVCKIKYKRGKPFLKITEEYFEYLNRQRELNTEID